MKEAIASGATVEEALAAACKELGVETGQAKFEVLEMPMRKTLGLFGGSPAKVRAYVDTDAPARRAAEYLRKILDALGLPHAHVDIRPEEGGAMLCVTGNDVGFIIGHRGETLDAIQYLCGLVANHEQGEYFRITLDIGLYREKRRETLDSLGKKLATRVLHTGRNCTLEPMNPYERHIIHNAVKSIAGVRSWSEGKDRNRHVIIGPEGGEKRAPRPYRGRNSNQARPHTAAYRPATRK